MSRTIGIDLGTTNSVMATLTAGAPEVISNAEGARLTPSVVSFDDSGVPLVGEAARRRAVTAPDRTFIASKRMIGSSWSAEVDGVRVDATDLAAHVLRKLKADAESYLGEEVSSAVITVPARFDNAQRSETRRAGELAGLEVLRLVAEPTAAAFSHGLDHRRTSNALVFDLGGGTLDVAVLSITAGSFEVRATAGDTRLGGIDFDRALVDWLLAEVRDEHDVDLSSDPVAMARIREAAEAAKVELSSLTSTQVVLPFLATIEGRGVVNLQRTVARELLEQISSDLIERISVPFTRALSDAGLTVGQLSDIVVVGGASQMPAVRTLLARLTGGRQAFRGVNPSEAVALGAALHGGVLQGEVKDVLLLDATPLSLGIETRGGATHRLIERNTTIPTRSSEVFTTAVDGQSSVDIHIVQGERPLAADNISLGTFSLSNIRPAPRGVPKIEVTFDIDADGIMHVSATDTSVPAGQGASGSLLITSGARVRSDQVDDAVASAVENEQADRAAAANVRLRVQAESLVHQVDRTLMRYGTEVSEEVFSSVSRCADRLRAALSGGDDQTIRSALSDLREHGRQLSLAIFAAQERSGEVGSSPRVPTS